MNLNDCSQMARNILINHGLPHFNLIFFGLPSPRGFCYRNTIGLSFPFIEANSADEIEKTVLHECSHAWTNNGHGTEFLLEADWRGAKPFEDRLFDPDYERRVNAYLANRALVDAGERFLREVAARLDEWADEGKQGNMDLYTFAYPHLEVSTSPKTSERTPTQAANKATSYEHREAPCRGNCVPDGGYVLNLRTDTVKPFMTSDGGKTGHTPCKNCKNPRRFDIGKRSDFIRERLAFYKGFLNV